MPKQRSQSYEKIYAVVKRIPRGRVASYGQVAEWAGLPGRARLVGYALSALRKTDRVPWQRVLNARGVVSQGGAYGSYQRVLLESEGITFDRAGRVDMARFAWRPRG